MDTNTSEIRQAENKVFIEGTVNEKRMEIKDIDGKDAITGEIDIKTGDNSIHTVRVFSYKFKTDGSPNGVFKGLETVMNEYKTIAVDGADAADKVKISGAQLGVNEYWGQDGILRSITQLSTNFINRLKTTDTFNPRAEFEIEVYIEAMIDETDKEGIETGRLKVKGLTGIYGGKIIPLEFIVADDSAIDYIRGNYNQGDTVKLFGEVINNVIRVEKTPEVAFGKATTRIFDIVTRELLITGGLPAYDDDNPKKYSVDAIRKARVERDNHLDELKKKNENNAPSSPSPNAGGFNTKSNKGGKAGGKATTPVDDELPF
jgi:hypothetical protein